MTYIPTASYDITTILDAVSDAVILTDTTGIVLLFNRTAEAIFGYYANEVLGHSLDLILPAGFVQQHQEHLKRFAHTTTPDRIMDQPYNITGRHKDGTEVPLTATVCRLTQNQQTGFAAILRNGTDHPPTRSEIAWQPALPEHQIAAQTAAETTYHATDYFRLLAEYTSDLVCLHEPDGRYLYLSPSCERLLGYQPAELIGTDAFKLFHPDDIAHIQTNSHQHVLAGQTISSVAYRIRQRSGEYIWFETFTQPIMNEQGHVVQLVTASRDITDRQRAETALRESEQRYRAFVEHSPDMIMVSSLTGQILFINGSGARVLGIDDPGQLGHRLVSDFFELNCLPTSWQQPSDATTAPPVSLIEHQIQRSDGQIRYLEITSLPIQYQETLAVFSIGRDVTARRLSREDLYESEQRFQAIFEQTFQHIGLLNPDGTVFKINHSALMFIGLRPADVIGQPIWETYFWNVTPEEREQTRALIAKAATGIFAFLHCEASIQGANNRTAIIEFSLKPLKDPAGTVSLLLLEGHDITEQRLAESQLRESQERYQAVVEQVAEGIFLLDTHTMRFIETNRTFQHLLGYTAEEFQHLTMYDIITDQMIEEIRFNIGLALHNGQHFIVEDAQYVRKDGSLIDVELSTSLITYATTSILCVVVRDITERQQAQARVRESEARYRHIVETATEGIWLIDENSITTFVNQKMADMLGRTCKEMLGQPLTALLDGSEWPGATAHTEWRHDNFTAQSECCFQHKDGTRVWTLSNANPIFDQQGQYRGALAMFTDITERKRAETALDQERALLTQRVTERTAELSAANAALARAVRLKDEFLANMSHELRTPLHAVLGQAEVLAEEIYGALTVEQHRSVQMIEQSGRHLLSVINDILDLTKIEAGKAELDIQPVALATCCQASLQFIKQFALKKDISVSFSMDQAITMIYADGRRLKQVLVNLLNNAVKFTPEHGQIGLEVTADPDQGVIALTVWDTGIGISEQQMDRLFQPFVQVDSGLARRHEGTGLGLYLVHRLIDMHDGNVSLESSEGQGSRFTITLPWCVPDPSNEEDVTLIPPPPVPSPPPYLRPHPPTLLLAEDSEANITLLSDYLTAMQYRVIVARNGGEAIERAQEERPAIILMDIQMPEMDGLEATRQIRADATLDTVPIIALTALTMPGDRERCLEAGINEYLGKPVSLRHLVQIIETLLPPVATAKE